MWLWNLTIAVVLLLDLISGQGKKDNLKCSVCKFSSLMKNQKIVRIQTHFYYPQKRKICV